MPGVGETIVLDREGFAGLLQALIADGRELIGPTVRDGAIVLDTLRGIADLPRGIGDEQAPGRYRLRERGDDALFGYAASPYSWKRELLPPRVPLVQIRRSAGKLAIEAAPTPTRKVAFIGARACELAAIAVQDRVLRDGAHPDADYRARREDVFVLAVHCGSPAGTCFCVSMDTGPRARHGHDLAATELLDAAGHRFVVEIATERGAAIASRVASRPATTDDTVAATAVTDDAATRMGRTMQTQGLRDALMGNLEHPRWQAVAERCLGCANCTMSCPTCFCTNVEDTTDLSGDHATRTRRWDSCFTADFAYVHGGSVRPSLRARYRQWLTHKLATWHDQFGTSGCVGCGRCITWCPVGIDITEEVAAIRTPPTRSPRDG
ncbi:MAG TPA: 4Fe-4S dicluster domain-containing protein [Kofleriaceae bacterium]|nr:4Fe-4S dicluster domain-containing protein [Kofleriaceae bacterium]